MDAEEILRRHLAELKDATKLEAKIIEDGNGYCVIIESVVVPAGFSKIRTDMLFKADRQYPLSSMDMFWVDEDLTLAGGQTPKNADQFEEMAGRRWRRFSWHSSAGWDTAGNPLMDHYTLSEARLLEEPDNQRLEQ
jgi:hypothetical protein